VHRLFERAGSLSGSAADDASDTRALIHQRVEDLRQRALRPDEVQSLDDPDAFADSAVEVWRRAQARTDVREALAGPARFYEVPFSMAEGALVFRGTIDCVVQKDDGSLLVVELKTGRPREAHERQLELYVRAVRLLHGTAGRVSGLLLYV
jgi:RecB family exonuclease